MLIITGGNVTTIGTGPVVVGGGLQPPKKESIRKQLPYGFPQRADAWRISVRTIHTKLHRHPRLKDRSVSI